jgi:hypothetical protein
MQLMFWLRRQLALVIETYQSCTRGASARAGSRAGRGGGATANAARAAVVAAPTRAATVSADLVRRCRKVAPNVALQGLYQGVLPSLRPWVHLLPSKSRSGEQDGTLNVAFSHQGCCDDVGA